MTRHKNPVPASSAASDYAKAATLFEQFTGHRARELGYVSVPELPKTALLVGTVDWIFYTTVRDGKKEKYKHRFHASDRPLLVVAPGGKSLYLVGGNFEFTERGIVDASEA